MKKIIITIIITTFILGGSSVFVLLNLRAEKNNEIENLKKIISQQRDTISQQRDSIVKLKQTGGFIIDEKTEKGINNINDFISNTLKGNDYPNNSFKAKFKKHIDNFDKVIFRVTFKKKGKDNFIKLYTGTKIFKALEGARKGKFMFSKHNKIVNERIKSDTIHITIIN